MSIWAPYGVVEFDKVHDGGNYQPVGYRVLFRIYGSEATLDSDYPDDAEEDIAEIAHLVYLDSKRDEAVSKFETFMVELTASAEEFTKAMERGRVAAEKLAVTYWRLLPWWAKVAHFIRHPVGAVRLIRTAYKKGKTS